MGDRWWEETNASVASKLAGIQPCPDKPIIQADRPTLGHPANIDLLSEAPFALSPITSGFALA